MRGAKVGTQNLFSYISSDAIARRRYPGQRQGLTEAQIPREWWTFSLRGTRILGQRSVTADHFPVRSGFP